MVRKWSYLSPNPLTTFFSIKKTVNSRYSFKVFRNTTRFKKSITFPTVFFRKKDSIRKRKTNWLTLTSILCKWSFLYLQYRQLIRFHQNMVILPVSLFTPNIDVLQKKTNNNDLIPWNSITIARQSGKIFKKFQKNANYCINPLNFSRATTIFTSTVKELVTVDYITPGIITYETSLIPSKVKNTQFFQQLIPSNIAKVQTKQLNNSLITLYKCMIHLTLLNLIK